MSLEISPSIRPFALLLALAAVALPTLAAGPAAVIEQPVIDVGVVTKGETIEQEFEVRNDGDAPLEIMDVQSTCGCAVAEFDRTIAPGRTGRVLAVLSTESLDGPIAKTVTLYTSDPTNPRLDLVVKANVKVHIEAMPSYARFLLVHGETPVTLRSVLLSESLRNLLVKRVESPYPFLDVRYHEAEPQERIVNRDGRQWTIEVTLPSTAPVGPLADYLVIHTNHPRQPQFKLPIQGFVQPTLAVTPRVADVGRQSLDRPYVITFEVKNQGTPDVDLTAATTSVPGAEVTIERKEPGRLFKVLVTLPTDLPKGELDGVLRIQTSSEAQPLVEIDLLGTVI